MTHRPIYKIAEDIREHWEKPYFGAVPYLNAMMDLTDPNDMYGMDSGASILRYFLTNARFWRGDDARRLKAEIKELFHGVLRADLPCHDS